MRDLRALAKAIIFFEDAIGYILPSHRVNNAYCMRNYLHNLNFKMQHGKFVTKTTAYGLIGAYIRSPALSLMC